MGSKQYEDNYRAPSERYAITDLHLSDNIVSSNAEIQNSNLVRSHPTKNMYPQCGLGW